MKIVVGDYESTIILESLSIEEYRHFLRIKTLPSYTFDGNVFKISNRFLSLIDSEFEEEEDRKFTLSPFLFDYQKFIVDLALQKKKFAVFADCGLGKTLIFLEWMKRLLPFVRGKVLIVSPLMVIEQTIEEEKKFYRSSSITNIYRSDIDAWLDSDSRVGIINYDKFRKKIDLRGEVDIVILDESSILKSESGVIKTNIIDSCKGIPYKMACTATPAPNDREEYANHALFLDEIRSHKEFFHRYFVKKDSEWVLRPHATEHFYRFLAMFSIFLRSPVSYGFSDNLREMKPLTVKVEILPLTKKQVDIVNQTRGKDYYGFGVSKIGIGGISKRGKFNQISKGFLYEDGKVVSVPSIKPDWICDLVNDVDGQILIWTCYDEEEKILLDFLREKTDKKIALVTGKTKELDRLRLITEFKRGEIDVLISKPRILGFGLNFQNCSTVIFSGLLDSYEQYYQALRRVYRYGNFKEITVWVPLTEYEEVIYNNVLKKRDCFESDSQIQEGLYRDIIMPKWRGDMKNEGCKKGRERQKSDIVRGKNYTIAHGDNIQILDSVENTFSEIDDDSIGLSIFSPPFVDLFVYSSDIADMGNCSDEEFTLNYRFFASRLIKKIIPGRKVCVHVSQLPILKSVTGYIGMKDFRGLIIEAMETVGFLTKTEVAIKKNQQMQSIVKHAPGLAMHIFETDSNKSLPCYNDYVLIFEKPGDNPIPTNPVKNGDMTRDDWIKYASGCWMISEEVCDIRESDTLNTRGTKSEDDIKHICPLQLEVVRRFVKLYTNPDEWVLDPFGGIGTTGVICAELNRNYYGIELKDEYFNQQVENVINAYKSSSMRLLRRRT